MSREIKFRFVFKNNENGDIYFKVYSLDQLMVKPLSELADVGVFSTLISKDQFTGRCDRDGDEIFDGDILSLYDRHLHVFWNKTICGFSKCCLMTGNVFEFDHRPLPHKVIGDVHRNPELLE